MKGAPLAYSLFLTLGSLSAEGLTPDAVKLPVRFQPEPEIQVQVTASKGKIRMQIGKNKPVEIGELETGSEMTGNKPVMIADFNFDGAKDLAVLDGIGYGGVNMFYRIYLWEKGKERFREMKEPIGNPVLRKDRGFLLSAQRSGPRWYQTLYRVIDGEIYRYADAMMLNQPRLWGLTFPDEQGKAGKRAVVNAKWFEGDLQEFPAIEAYYAESFCDGEKMPAKAIHGKEQRRVTVLDFRDDGAELKIHEKGKKGTRWVAAECVLTE